MTNKELRVKLMAIKWPKGTKLSDAIKVVTYVEGFTRNRVNNN